MGMPTSFRNDLSSSGDLPRFESLNSGMDLIDKMGGTKEVLNIYENVQVFDFFFKGFHKLRYQDGITKEMIAYSFWPDYNFKNIKKAGESKGKSGSFMFFTHDNRFIIKTMF